jgi:hypothetical protein
LPGGPVGGRPRQGLADVDSHDAEAIHHPADRLVDRT